MKSQECISETRSFPVDEWPVKKTPASIVFNTVEIFSGVSRCFSALRSWGGGGGLILQLFMPEWMPSLPEDVIKEIIIALINAVEGGCPVACFCEPAIPLAGTTELLRIRLRLQTSAAVDLKSKLFARAYFFT